MKAGNKDKRMEYVDQCKYSIKELNQGGFGVNGRGFNKGVWARIVGAIRHMNDTLVIPWETLVRKVGNGSNVKFWLDEWIDNQPLKDRFNRLFYLESNKSCMLNERFVNDSWRWEWRRQIRGGREQEQLQQLLDLLQNVQLSDNMDSFSWSLDTSGDFLVSNTRAHIDNNTLSSGILATRWPNYIPRKVNIFIWRLLLDKLPTRHNLSLRGLDIESLMCPICDRSVENTFHLFLGCDVTQQVWLKIARWCGLDWPSITSLDDLFVWVDSHPNSRNRRRCLESITYASLWILWRHRNAVLFNDKPVRRSEIFDQIVMFSFNWLYYRASKVNVSWNAWLMCPL